MPIKIYWDNPKKDIIRVDIIGDWTWRDYLNANIKLNPMFLSVEHRVDILADMREANPVPNEVDSSQFIKRGRESRPENYGFTVNVGADAVTRAIFSSGTTISETKNKQIFFVNTLEEAYAIIEKAHKMSSKS